MQVLAGGYGIIGSYRFIYFFIYYLNKYCRAGGYPPDQNFKIRYPSVIRIFKISVSVSVSIYTHRRMDERTNGSVRLVGRIGFHGFLPTPTCNFNFLLDLVKGIMPGFPKALSHTWPLKLLKILLFSVLLNGFLSKSL